MPMKKSRFCFIRGKLSYIWPEDLIINTLNPDCQVDITFSWYRSAGEGNGERSGEGNLYIVRLDLRRNREGRKPQEES